MSNVLNLVRDAGAGAAAGTAVAPGLGSALGAAGAVVLDVAPELGKWLAGGQGQQVATQVAGILKSVTGTDDPDAQVKTLQNNPDSAAPLRLQLAQLAAQQADAAQTALLAAVSGSDQSQVRLDQQEGTSTSLFISGWRPAIGWVCGAAFAWDYFVRAVIGDLAAVFHYPLTLPAPASNEDMMTVLLGMLGLGAYRTVEKINKAQNTEPDH